MADSPIPGVTRLRAALQRDDDSETCGCRPSFDGDTLALDAAECPFGGAVESRQECRETVIEALTNRDVEAVRTEADGLERDYDGSATALLVAAGRFVEAVGFHDERLAETAREDPLAAAREAMGRADVVSEIAAETGLAELAVNASGYETALAPSLGPTLSHWRVELTPPSDSALTDVTELETGGTVRRYEQARGQPRYHLVPVEHQLPAEALSVLDRAYRRLARGEFEGGDRAPARAVRAVTSSSTERPERDWTETLTQVLRKHARGYGLLEDLFADPAVTDAFVTAPAASNRVRVNADDQTYVTNVTVTDEGVTALSSRFRRESGRAFSRADPTLDATGDVAGRRLRIAGVTEPTSTGVAFAFRAQGRAVWTLPALVDNGTISAAGAALLSIVVERGGTVLVAGPRGAGKTTMLGALLWELPPSVRTVVIEDTPELPVATLQQTGRDVQALLASAESEELSPTEALRTALRLGDGALVVGEVRGEEASVLYEAMRVGANSEAVLGTIHGDGGDAVYERVVTDLGVSPSAFGVTDLVVSLESTAEGDRRVKRIEEVLDGHNGEFATLYRQTADGLSSTSRIDRGNSRLLEGLRRPGESYADLRSDIDERQRLIDALAARDATSGVDVTESHAERDR